MLNILNLPILWSKTVIPHTLVEMLHMYDLDKTQIAVLTVTSSKNKFKTIQ